MKVRHARAFLICICTNHAIGTFGCKNEPKRRGKPLSTNSLLPGRLTPAKWRKPFGIGSVRTKSVTLPSDSRPLGEHPLAELSQHTVRHRSRLAGADLATVEPDHGDDLGARPREEAFVRVPQVVAGQIMLLQ